MTQLQTTENFFVKVIGAATPTKRIIKSCHSLFIFHKTFASSVVSSRSQSGKYELSRLEKLLNSKLPDDNRENKKNKS